jgi:hypothetical protein
MHTRPRFVALLIAAAAPLAAAQASAHHSVPGTFNVDKTVSIKGTINKIDWINPHIYIYVDVKDRSGAVTQWKVETLPTNHMRRAGITKEEILKEAGSGEVTMHMYPAHINKTAGFLLRLTFPEGHFMHLYGEESEITR